MALAWSRELAAVVDESRDVAQRLHQPLTSAHLLLCLFTLKNRASLFLSDQDVTADRLLEHLREKPSERDETWDRVLRRAVDVAHVAGSPRLTSLHVLVALCSFVDSAAYQLMAALDLDMGTMRSTALSYLTTAAEADDEPDDAAASAPAAATVAARTQAVGGTADARADRAAVCLTDDDEPDEADEPPRGARGIREPDDVRRRRRRRDRGPAAPSAPSAPTRPAANDDATRSLAARLYGNAPIAQRRGVVRPTDYPLPPTVNRTGANPAVPAQTASPRRAALQRHQLVLRDHQFPLLARIGRNLTLAAWDGAIDRVVGRDAEIDQVIDILNKRRSNNPVLVGDPGVGKTAVVEGLARRVVGLDDEEVPAGLAGRIVIELEASQLVSGTGLRGSFAERMQKLKREVAEARGRVIVFLDELHHWMGMGAGGDGAADGAGELKTALARGEFPCIGATTYDEFRRFVEADPAFARRFQQVRVDEPSPDDAVAILSQVREHYEEHHGVRFELDAIEAAVRLAHRFLPDRRLPDKAIGVLDLAGSRARRIGAAAVGRPLVATIVAEQAGVAPDKLLMGDRERFLNLEEQLMHRVVGHRHVIERVSLVLRRNYAGFVSGRPIGTFLLLGPTGVGKTEFARAVASVVFHDEDAMLRLDMSEFMEPHSVARLIGSPPGYVGHDAGGQLTESVRRSPYQLVLLDEIEKAHPDVLNLLIQVFDEGHLTDARGRTVDFSNTIILLTSNLGAAEAMGASQRRVGFGADIEAPVDRTSAVLEAARRHFRPELWNRLDETLSFAPLTRDEVARIARLQLTRSSERLLDERGISYACTPDVIDLLIASGGFDPELGARPMRRTIERLVEAPIAELILTGAVAPPAQLDVLVQGGEIVVRPVSSDEDA